MQRRCLLILAAMLTVAAAAAQDAALKDVEKAMNALNDAFKNRDADKIQRLITDNHVAITSYYGGPQNKAEQLKTLPDLKMSEYSSTDVKVTLLDKDTALVTYALTLKGTYKGKELPAKNYAAAVWVLQGGKWLEAFYQETPLAGK